LKKVTKIFFTRGNDNGTVQGAKLTSKAQLFSFVIGSNLLTMPKVANMQKGQLKIE
jgi:hypothetical protein